MPHPITFLLRTQANSWSAQLAAVALIEPTQVVPCAYEDWPDSSLPRTRTDSLACPSRRDDASTFASLSEEEDMQAAAENERQARISAALEAMRREDIAAYGALGQSRVVAALGRDARVGSGTFLHRSTATKKTDEEHPNRYKAPAIGRSPRENHQWHHQSAGTLGTILRQCPHCRGDGSISAADSISCL